MTNTSRLALVSLALFLTAGSWLTAAQAQAQENPAPPAAETKAEKPAAPEDAEPCITDPNADGPCVDSDKMPRFVNDSPFDVGPKPPMIKRERRLWADSWLWAKAPKLEVEKWLSDKPKTEGKYVLIEVWATWCGPCRRSISLLNELHKKYGDELVVIGICEEDEQAVKRLTKKYPGVPEIEFYSAVDTQKRVKDKLGVWGIPHAILLEPDGFVIWEGFPLQPGYELTDSIIERVLAVGRKLKAGS